MHDDVLTKEETPGRLRRVLSETAAKDAPKAERGLPTLLDGEYRPYARPSNQPLFSIHFIAAGGDVRSFQYMHLCSDSSYTPQQILLRFTASKMITVLISGRNLWELYDYIHEHRMPWVREASRDFALDGESIVTKLSFYEDDDVPSLS
jgi:hypothetical protein